VAHDSPPRNCHRSSHQAHSAEGFTMLTSSATSSASASALRSLLAGAFRFRWRRVCSRALARQKKCGVGPKGQGRDFLCTISGGHNRTFSGFYRYDGHSNDDTEAIDRLYKKIVRACWSPRHFLFEHSLAGGIAKFSSWYVLHRFSTCSHFDRIRSRKKTV
jgi:hypothetical protein